MITNKDVFNALKTLRVFCADHQNCNDCPLADWYEGCAFERMVLDAKGITKTNAPAFWDVERYCRPLLDN